MLDRVKRWVRDVLGGPEAPLGGASAFGAAAHGTGRSTGAVRTGAPADEGRPTSTRDRVTTATVGEAMAAARLHLLDRQAPEGFWVGELVADTTLESDTILLLRFLGRRDPVRVDELARYILSQQTAERGWALYPGGPAEINATVKAYLALKVAGYRAEDPALRRAAETIARLGGLGATNSYTRMELAVFGQLPWSRVPAILPELILFPNWFPFNIYEVSSWSRAILVPLTIVHAAKPRVELTPAESLRELAVGRPDRQGRRNAGSFVSWESFFYSANQILKLYDRRPSDWLRRRALRQATDWTVERIGAGSLGAIYPAMVHAVMALHVQGFGPDHPAFARAWDALLELDVPLPGGMRRVQPCFSPIWDTAWCAIALARSGDKKGSAAVQEAADWLIDKEVRRPGDWSVKAPGLEPGGWYFEFENEFFPDVDDTVAVLMALRLAGRTGPAVDRGLKWLMAMQNRDGGWGAFDRENTHAYLTHVPFADHNAMIDPSTADLTGRILEYLGWIGRTPAEDPDVARAVEFLKRVQEPDGAWFGRWGVNYVYGTWQVIKGLLSVGENPQSEYVRGGVDWLKTHQNADGGWGETCRSYDDPSLRGRGPSTPSQTAWAVLGILAAEGPRDRSVRRGIDYLVRMQTEDGTWEEDVNTGTGFPQVFYLQYTMYRHYFPLLTLAEFLRAERAHDRHEDLE